MQMLRDRGYIVGDFEVDMTKQQFIQKYGENMKREDLVINKTNRNDSLDRGLIISERDNVSAITTLGSGSPSNIVGLSSGFDDSDDVPIGLLLHRSKTQSIMTSSIEKGNNSGHKELP
ncbi:DNA-directed RNA polymerases II and IV subunit 5A [Camellia lanceoleosa]|uniref:DNA-directed RNA polymerases II and IV subunit 5A n=1 Tax=Camellia lanceoleosa TaxID=1840588 RepID=A0ACC0GRX0_9ERIC|nr:DNA-directed RNA polymerases II and IV subunit 5A [Camellia lanceoleosa]